MKTFEMPEEFPESEAGWNEEDEDEEDPRERDRKSVSSYPQTFASFTAEEGRVWALGPPPVGSVVTVTLQPVEDGDHPAIVALMVLVALEKEDGYWLQVKLLGCDQTWAKSQAVSDFSRQKKHLHICRAPLESGCTNIRGVHVKEFGVWPPGKFRGSYVDPKKMGEMKKFLDELATTERPSRQNQPKRHLGGWQPYVKGCSRPGETELDLENP